MVNEDIETSQWTEHSYSQKGEAPEKFYVPGLRTLSTERPASHFLSGTTLGTKSRPSEKCCGCLHKRGHCKDYCCLFGLGFLCACVLMAAGVFIALWQLDLLELLFPPAEEEEAHDFDVTKNIVEIEEEPSEPLHECYWDPERQECVEPTVPEEITKLAPSGRATQPGWEREHVSPVTGEPHTPNESMSDELLELAAGFQGSWKGDMDKMARVGPYWRGFLAWLMANCSTTIAASRRAQKIGINLSKNGPENTMFSWAIEDGGWARWAYAGVKNPIRDSWHEGSWSLAANRFDLRWGEHTMTYGRSKTTTPLRAALEVTSDFRPVLYYHIDKLSEYVEFEANIAVTLLDAQHIRYDVWLVGRVEDCTKMCPDTVQEPSQYTMWLKKQ